MFVILPPRFLTFCNSMYAALVRSLSALLDLSFELTISSVMIISPCFPVILAPIPSPINCDVPRLEELRFVFISLPDSTMNSKSNP